MQFLKSKHCLLPLYLKVKVKWWNEIVSTVCITIMFLGHEKEALLCLDPGYHLLKWLLAKICPYLLMPQMGNLGDIHVFFNLIYTDLFTSSTCILNYARII